MGYNSGALQAPQVAYMPKKSEGRTGRPALYEKPHRTTIMQSSKAVDELLPDLKRWIRCSLSDIYEKALREFHRQELELRKRRA